MKKVIAVIFLLVAIIVYFFVFLKPAAPSVRPAEKPTPTNQILPTGSISKQVLFVPYWSDNSIASHYATYVYFAVTPDESGINNTDDGYNGLPAFLAATQGKQTLLTVSMTNDDITQKILQDKILQENIIQDTLQLLGAYGFSGVVLDLEYHGLAFDNVTESVTNFSTRFAKEIKAQNFLFYQALYGDTFYLDRPYDVSQIAKADDGIFVLAYDFHKADGTPGPNFPLIRNEDADYDFSDMISDFSKNVPSNKLTIIFGMFGYDWTVDDKNRPEKPADSLTDSNIQAKFLQHCTVKNCVIHRNPATEEPSITYADNNGNNHIVWFEDAKSLVPKEIILQQNGISQVGFWGNDYF